MTGATARALMAHLDTGSTTVCNAWLIARTDGAVFAFTDHDLPLTFGGITFKPDSGLTARAITQTTGLSVDNTEAIGALSDSAIREEDIEQGRFDGAEVQVWRVNWENVAARQRQFRGTMGEVTRADGTFRAELRGLAEALNLPLGRVFQKPCTAVLGDAHCRFDLSQPGYSETLGVAEQTDCRVFSWPALPGFDPGWFARGRLEVQEGPSQGLWGIIKHDRVIGERRVIELWQSLRGPVAQGTVVRLVAGCDKRLETCRLKFLNVHNYQGFPDLPGEDWVMAVPKARGANTGGSRR